MNKTILILAIICYCAVAALSIIITTYDKIAAKKRLHRVPESILLCLGFFGGAMPMYLTMKLIHHKTRHAQFMLGLHAMIVFQLIAILGAAFFIVR